jgi:hypothetical protein
MTTRMDVYKGYELKAIEQPDGRWMVEMVEVGGGGKPFLTQTHREQADAMASARRIIDNSRAP